jgi:hypothetical protein
MRRPLALGYNAATAPHHEDVWGIDLGNGHPHAPAAL